MNPFFEVTRQDIFTEKGVQIPNKHALINTEDGSCLGIVSPNYELVHNQDVAALFEEALVDYPVAKTIDHLNSDGRKWRRMVLFDKNELNFEISKGDTVGLALSIFNGYDGSTSFGFDIFGYRWLCENGMVTGKKSLMKETFHHFEDSTNRLVESFEMKFDKFNENILTWKEWASTPMPQEEFVEFVDTRKYIKSDKIKEQITGWYLPLKEKEKMEETRWLAFNVLTYVMTHVTKARRGSNVFSNRYQTLSRMAEDLYSYEGDKSLVVSE